jgi:glycerol-3-phosphate acyltransferase PlsY
MTMMTLLQTLLLGYLLGSVPFGLFFTRLSGAGDIRAVGSGNIGATNVFRSLGKPAGIFVLLVDGLKGWLAVVLWSPGRCSSFSQAGSLFSR